MLENNLGSFIHLGLPVIDLIKVKNWYRDILGYSIIHEPKIVVENQTIHICFLQKGELVLEFYELLEDEKQDYWTRHNGYIDHFALKVDDLPKISKYLVENGAKPIEENMNKYQNYDNVNQSINARKFHGIYGEKFEIIESSGITAAKNFTFDHIGIAYTDENITRNFYNKLGFDASRVIDVNKNLVVMRGKTKFIFFWENKEIIEERKDGLIDHIAFEVLDINSAYKELISQNFNILEDEPVELPFWDKGIKYFNFRGPSGEKLELEQRII